MAEVVMTEAAMVTTAVSAPTSRPRDNSLGECHNPHSRVFAGHPDYYEPEERLDYKYPGRFVMRRSFNETSSDIEPGGRQV